MDAAQRVIFCGGSAKADTWAIRGQQIASRRKNWIAVNDPTDEMLEESDIIVVVKRFTKDLAARIRAARKPVIWDAIDFWQQPEDGLKISDPQQAARLAFPAIEALQPKAIIAATQLMALDLQGLAEIVTCIYHHSSILLKRPENPGKTLYYEGSPRFLGEWRDRADIAAARAGWIFRSTVPQNDAGALLAVRGGEHGCFLSRRWKSNIKAANAIALGVPLIAWPEAGYVETVPNGLAHWFMSEAELQQKLQLLNDPAVINIAATAAATVREKFSLTSITREYEALFSGLSCA